jgi:hypothetical protein
MDGLIVRQPFARLIIEGRKDWEIRSRKPPKNKTGREIYLLSEGEALGKIKIVSFHGPLSKEELDSTANHHFSPQKHFDSSVFAWILSVSERFLRPVGYHHPIGARVWVLDVRLKSELGKKGRIRQATLAM